MSEEVIDVFIEIPKGSRNKYEYDKKKKVIRLDRRLLSATTYPADYGFIPGTLGEDGDALDALVLVDEPTFPGCLVQARPVGVFWMEDEKGPDAKVICMPGMDPLWDHISEVEQLPNILLREIEHFFEVYKTIEDKKVATDGFEGKEAALKEIEAARERLVEES